MAGGTGGGVGSAADGGDAMAGSGIMAAGVEDGVIDSVVVGGTVEEVWISGVGVFVWGGATGVSANVGRGKGDRSVDDAGLSAEVDVAGKIVG